MTVRAKPVIGLTADTDEGKGASRPPFKGETIYWLKKSYFNAVERSGGLPFPITPAIKPSTTDAYLDLVDGLIVTGGYFDIDPALYGEKPIARIDEIKPDRTLMEIRLIKKAVRLRIPVLGICGGHQAINIAFGGSLYQDIDAQAPDSLKHEQKPKPVTKTSHEVTITGDSMLRQIVGKDKINVNSTHHQAVKKAGKGLKICATAPDGIIEAIERDGDGSFLVGAQWHPEQIYESDKASRKLFGQFINKCIAYKNSR
ncbi:Glutamine amidotransferase, class I [hydrothermal vent metagenome]|uniref:Glutamine amidotransferase, class I n=1 Tax=hydrothermal vent metagenome TaxID=652676 RepID=A0A3B1BZ78_9ZZZZ